MKQRRLGFTLIEVLTVTVIIGVLAAIAIPQYYRVKGKAYIASMQSDLRNLVTAEEMYFAEHGSYTGDVSDLENFRLTSGVTVAIADAGLQGWSATAAHSASEHSCRIAVGRASSGGQSGAAVGGGEGIPTCDLALPSADSPGERAP